MCIFNAKKSWLITPKFRSDRYSETEVHLEVWNLKRVLTLFVLGIVNQSIDGKPVFEPEIWPGLMH